MGSLVKDWWLASLLCVTSLSQVAAQQMADTNFYADIVNPAYPIGTGPVVLIDEAHNNYHTADGRYLAFATLLRRDGYLVRGSNAPFTPDLLDRAAVLVISNALHERNLEDWSLPTPSAFTRHEIAAVRVWVQAGGSLMLIADHMPMPGAAAALAAAFDVEFLNGFAFESATDTDGPIIFRRSDGSLESHPVTDGRAPNERVDSVVSFTGQAFRVGAGARSLMTFRSDAVSLNPRVAWRFGEATEKTQVGGWSQGAVLEFGHGRVAVFGEAAMFTAQVAVEGANRFLMGMNRPEANQNQQFLLNIMHWLSALDQRSDAEGTDGQSASSITRNAVSVVDLRGWTVSCRSYRSWQRSVDSGVQRGGSSD
jgi:hypothetical protein